MQTLIAEAIASRSLLRLEYNGSTRIIEPHIYGLDTRGHPALSAYQVTGGSLSGENHGWKTFDIRKIHGLQLLESHFRQPRPEYNASDPKFRTIYRRL
jgi:hypothetical protein